MDTDFVNKVKESLKNKRKVVIITHVNPDGDAMGSSLALYGILEKENYDVKVVIPNEFPSFLSWMPFSDKILVNTIEQKECHNAIKNAEIIFCLDFNDVNRMAELSEVFRTSKAEKFLIDHHLDPSVFTDHTLSIINTSSTSEIIWDFLVTLGKINLLDKNIAECLYVGIVTDTGSFSYACNHANTYQIIPELLKSGIDGEKIHRLVYDTFTESRMKLLGYCLNEKFVVIHEYATAFISLTLEDLEKFDYENGDTEGVVNYALSVKGVEMAALFMERDEHIKISFRSKGIVSVSDIARKYYSGGGHHNAAGGFSYKNMADTLIEFRDRLPSIMQKIK